MTGRRQGLVRFAIALGAAAVFYWLGRPILAVSIVCVGGALGALALASPRAAAALDRGLGRLVGAVVGLVLLVPLFYLVLTPFGLLRRLWRDPLARRIDPGAKTYWKPRTRAPRFDRPY